MPRLPQPTAQGRPAQANMPYASPWHFGSQAFHDTTEFGSTLQRTGFALQQQQDEIETVRLASEYDVKLPQVIQEVMDDPQINREMQNAPDERARMAIQQSELELRVGEMRKALTENSSPAVQQVLMKHQFQRFPQAVTHMQTETMKRRADANAAQLDAVMADKAVAIPQMADPESRAVALGEVRGLLERAVDGRTMTEDAAVQKWTRFQHGVLEHQMDYLRRTDRQQLRELDRSGQFDALGTDKRLKILSQASADELREESMRDKAHNEVRMVVQEEYQARANQGLLREDELRHMLAGRNAYVKPDESRELARVNAAPPMTRHEGGDEAVQAVMLGYHAGPSSLERIKQTRKSLLGLKVKSKDLDKAFNELQTDERTMRSVQASEMAAGIRFAEDEVKSKTQPTLPGRLGQKQKNMNEAELAEMRTKIRKGMKPEEAANSVIEKRKEEEEAMPKRRQRVLDALK